MTKLQIGGTNMSNVININKRDLQVKEHNGVRVVTFKDVDNLHERPEGTARRTFAKYKNKFVEGEDYFVCNTYEAQKLGITAPNGINLLTESGYLLLTKPFEDDLSWAVQKQLIKGYFAVREVAKTVEEVATGKLSPEMAYDSIRILMETLNQTSVSAESKALCVKALYSEAGINLPINIVVEEKIYDSSQIAARLGVYSNSGKPHYQAVSEIIKKVNIPEELKVVVMESKGNWQGTVVKYKEDAFAYVQKWLSENQYPSEIKTDKKSLKVVYKAD